MARNHPLVGIQWAAPVADSRVRCFSSRPRVFLHAVFSLECCNKKEQILKQKNLLWSIIQSITPLILSETQGLLQELLISAGIRNWIWLLTKWMERFLFALTNFGHDLEIGKTLTERKADHHTGEKCRVVFILWIVLPSIKDEQVLPRALSFVAVNNCSAVEGCEIVFIYISRCREHLSLGKIGLLEPSMWLVLPPRKWPLSCRAAYRRLPLQQHVELPKQCLQCSAKDCFADGKVSVSQFAGDALTVNGGKKHKSQALWKSSK